MKKYEDLSTEEQREIDDKAWAYHIDIETYGNTLFYRHTPKIAPVGSDLFHPELWKDIHWAWFFSKYRR